MLEMNLIATVLLAMGLFGGAALALWQLPWSDDELRRAQADMGEVRERLVQSLAPHQRPSVRVHPR